MIAVNGSSFGRAGGRLRRYPGGTENASILATVRGSIPKRRAASRRLDPFNLNRKTNPSVKLHALHPPAPAAADKGHLLPDFYSGATGRPGRFSEGFSLRRLQLPATAGKPGKIPVPSSMAGANSVAPV